MTFFFLSAQDQKFGEVSRFQIAITFEQKVVQIWSTRRWKAEISYFRNFYKTKWNSTRQSGIIGPEVRKSELKPFWWYFQGYFFHFVWSYSTLSCNGIESTPHGLSNTVLKIIVQLLVVSKKFNKDDPIFAKMEIVLFFSKIGSSSSNF